MKKKVIESLKVFTFYKKDFPVLEKGLGIEDKEYAINVTSIFEDIFDCKFKKVFFINNFVEKSYAETIAKRFVSEYNKNKSFWFNEGSVIIILNNGNILELSSSEWGFIKQL